MNTANKTFLATILGVGMGMLFAPKSGEETRADVSAKADEMKAKASSWKHRAQTKWHDMRSDAKSEADKAEDAM